MMTILVFFMGLSNFLFFFSALKRKSTSHSCRFSHTPQKHIKENSIKSNKLTQESLKGREGKRDSETHTHVSNVESDCGGLRYPSARRTSIDVRSNSAQLHKRIAFRRKVHVHVSALLFYHSLLTALPPSSINNHLNTVNSLYRIKEKRGVTHTTVIEEG